MSDQFNRRQFLKTTAAAGVGLTFLGGFPKAFAQNAANQVRIASIGVNSRGKALASTFARLKDARITHVCDVDSRAIEKCIAAIVEGQGAGVAAPKGVADFRRILDDPGIDAVVIASPDHWHAPMAIMALNAGKNVYVEKPCSHNAREGEMLVEAWKKSGKVVQMGNQRRSWPKIAEGVKLVQDGAIGDVHYARCWYANDRPSIGTGKPAPVPDWLDWELWQGPAPRKEYMDNLVHYNWHWFWHWGTGEGGNNAVHPLDLARWAFKAEYPTRVTSAGGRYYYEDDWKVPDTQLMSFEFGQKGLVTWEGSSANAMQDFGDGVGVLFEGSTGSLRLHSGNGYTIYDDKGKEVKVETAKDDQAITLAGPGFANDAVHCQNFLDAITKGTEVAANIDGGHKSTLLIHLGNIAQRTGRTVNFDPESAKIVDDPDQAKLWSREYEPGWEPKVG